MRFNNAAIGIYNTYHEGFGCAGQVAKQYMCFGRVRAYCNVVLRIVGKYVSAVIIVAGHIIIGVSRI